VRVFIKRVDGYTVRYTKKAKGKGAKGKGAKGKRANALYLFF
jgi:hypothetical protein